MIEPASPNEIPPGGWRWQHGETGHVISANSFDQLVIAARQFLGNNNYPIPRDLSDNILKWLDEAIQSDVHARGLPPYPLIRETEKQTLANQARKFAYAVTQWAKSGFRTISHEQYLQRLETCEACHHWQGESGFGYGKCGKCGCTGLKLFFPGSKCPDNPPRWGEL